MTDWLADSEANARRLAAEAQLSHGGTPIYGDHCVNCDREWALPADRATCAHKAICESCWPNGCEACIAEVEADLRRREVLVHTVTSAAEKLEQLASDLADSDLRALDRRVAAVLVANVDRATAALREIGDRAVAKGGVSA